MRPAPMPTGLTEGQPQGHKDPGGHLEPGEGAPGTHQPWVPLS